MASVTQHKQPPFLFDYEKRVYRTKHGIVELKMHPEFTAEMDQFRLKAFPASGTTSSRDAADDLSAHLTVRVDGELAAYGRCTPDPHACVRLHLHRDHLSQPFAFPGGPNVLYLHRGCVSKRFAESFLYEAMLVDTIHRANRSGFDALVGTILGGRGRLLERCHSLGFEDCGEVVLALPIGVYTSHMILYDLKKRKYDHKEICGAFVEFGFGRMAKL